MQSTFSVSVVFLKIIFRTDQTLCNGTSVSQNIQMGLSRENQNTNKLVNSFLPCRLCPCSIGLCFQACFQPIQWLSELQQTLYSPLLAFDNFSLHRFRDLAVYLIKCPSCWDRVPVSKFLSPVATEVFSPQPGPVLLQKASIGVAFIEGTYHATENTPPRLLLFITNRFRS